VTLFISKFSDIEYGIESNNNLIKPLASLTALLNSSSLLQLVSKLLFPNNNLYLFFSLKFNPVLSVVISTTLEYFNLIKLSKFFNKNRF